MVPERESKIECNYVSTGRNIISNKGGVGEQNLHSDYSGLGRDVELGED